VGLGLLSALGLAGTATPAQAAVMLPCDIYAAASTPCVAAHSTVRALYASYNGPLYQVKRASDGTTLNIGTLAAGGYANAAAQDSFCAGTTCTITEIFDQSPEHNNLTIGPAGGAGGADVGANAAALPVMAGGNKVYGVDVTPGVGYRDDATTGIATGSAAQGAYMVISATSSGGPATAAPTSNGRRKAGNWSTRRPASASTTPRSTPRTAPNWCSGAATAAGH
jgi:non-reducing end alpha-L-arabinofuranosidase